VFAFDVEHQMCHLFAKLLNMVSGGHLGADSMTDGMCAVPEL
jgi:hypothetical protein